MFAGEQEGQIWVTAGTPELKLWQALVACSLLQKGAEASVCVCAHTSPPPVRFA